MDYRRHRDRKVEAYWSASRPKLIGKPKLRPRPISNPLRPPTALRAPTAAPNPQSYEALPKNLRDLARRMDTLDNIRGAHLIAKELDKASATLNMGVPVRLSPEEIAANQAERERVSLSRPGFRQPAPVRPPTPQIIPRQPSQGVVLRTREGVERERLLLQRPGFQRPDRRTPAAIRARSPSPAPIRARSPSVRARSPSVRAPSPSPSPYRGSPPPGTSPSPAR